MNSREPASVTVLEVPECFRAIATRDSLPFVVDLAIDLSPNMAIRLSRPIPSDAAAAPPCR